MSQKEIDYGYLLNRLKTAKNIALCSHTSPDGDALGSMLSLYRALKTINSNTIALKVDKVPDYLTFLPILDELVVPEAQMQFDIFIGLDSSTPKRFGIAAELFNAAKETILIDHHKSSQYFADHNIVDNTASSTSELVFGFIKQLGLEYDKEMAELTFVGIVTDTGRFLYDNVKPDTHRISAELLEYGFDSQRVMSKLFQSSTLGSVYLTAELIDTTELYFENRMALTTITRKQLSELGATEEDLEEKVNIFRDVDGIEVSCLIRESSNGEIKVSMRSKLYFDVSQICVEFGGGGHVHAGGFELRKPMEEVKHAILEKMSHAQWR